MKKMLIVLLVVMFGLLECNHTLRTQAIRTTEIFMYDEEKEEYVLDEVRREYIDGIYDEYRVSKIRFQ